jgi:Trypsin-like peptidase domain
MLKTILKNSFSTILFILLLEAGKHAIKNYGDSIHNEKQEEIRKNPKKWVGGKPSVYTENTDRAATPNNEGEGEINPSEITPVPIVSRRSGFLTENNNREETETTPPIPSFQETKVSPNAKHKEELNNIDLESSIYNQVSPSVVKIIKVGKKGDVTKAGTGFLANTRPQMIITNRHVTENAKALLIISEQGFRIATNWQENTDVDCAIIEPTDNIPGNPLPLYKDNVPSGSKVFFIGHPLGEKKTITEGHIDGIFRDEMIFSGPLYHGESGSPIVNTRGEVIGVAYGMLMLHKEKNVGVPLTCLRTRKNWVEREGNITKGEIKYLEMFQNLNLD